MWRRSREVVEEGPSRLHLEEEVKELEEAETRQEVEEEAMNPRSYWALFVSKR
jgi:hypothetical protein